MKRVSRAVIFLFAGCSLLCAAFATATEVAAQRRSRRPPARVSAPRVDYSKFLHTTKQHQGNCVTCHKIPTPNWQRVREYPDVADYPDHEACVSCHRPQFFRGARPPICSVCHTRISPRDDVRFAFRNPEGRRQFQIEFPHDRHQDVIARLFRSLPRAIPEFMPASMTTARHHTQNPSPRYNNCEICHGPRRTPALTPVARWTDAFVPDDQTLKSVPSSHASCFTCHWKSEQPVNENCGGCHKLLPQPAAAASLTEVPKRISMKFRHGREQHVLECASCHINITRSASVRGLKPDVPITACSECHNKPPSHLEISNELAAIDKNRDFVCVYCHTSEVGRLDPPAGHYLIAERPPIKRKDVK